MLIGPVPSRRLPTGSSPWAEARRGPSATPIVVPTAKQSALSASRLFISIRGLPLNKPELVDGGSLARRRSDSTAAIGQIRRRRLRRTRPYVRPGPVECQVVFCGHPSAMIWTSRHCSGDSSSWAADEEVPLGHEGDERRVHGQMTEVGRRHRLIANLGAELPHFLVRQPEEVVEHAKLVHDLEGGGTNGVASEVAQEVAVLLEDKHVHACAREEETLHHACWADPRDAAAHVHEDSVRGMGTAR